MIYNNSMKKGRLKKGFTIIEVALFLAISGALFVMVIANTAARVTVRRYYDAVNDLAEELRNAYSATINVENYRRDKEDSGFFCSISSAYDNHGGLVENSSDTDNYPGRSRCAVYGQVITFGENDNTAVHRYDIIGLAKSDNIEPDPKASDDVLLASLSDAVAANGQPSGVQANIVTVRNNDAVASTCTISPAGNNYAYLPQWNATIENKSNHDLYHGAVMIVRSPISGTIHTYIYTNNEHKDPKEDNDPTREGYNAFNVQQVLQAGTKSCGDFAYLKDSFIKEGIDKNRWVALEADGTETYMDICVGGEDSYDLNNRRRAIRIHGDGSTESAVEVLPEAQSNEVCGL